MSVFRKQLKARYQKTLRKSAKLVSCPRRTLLTTTLYKIWPVVNDFNEKFQSTPMSQRLCVDEQMCPTKMKTFLLQYLPNKPHKWGVKFLYPLLVE